MTKINISPWFVLMIILFYAFEGTHFTVYLLISAVLHEIGHIICTYRLHRKIEKISAEPFKICIEISNPNTLSYKEEIILALSGPLVNILIAATFFMLLQFTNLNFVEDFQFIIIINLSIFAVNMLPIYPLDGGRIFYAALKQHFDYDIAKKVNDVMSVIILLPFLFLSFLILVMTGYNVSMIFICIFLVISIYKRFTTVNTS